MKTAILAALFCTGTLLTAAPITFDFKDPKGVNNVVFQMDAPLEAINGSASGITGSVSFDPQNPGATTGKIVVAASSLTVPNGTMKEHMHGKDWLNVAANPEITFEAVKLENAKTKDNVTSADVTGKMTIKGVTKNVKVPVTLTYLKDKIKARGGFPGKDGDILVLRANFAVKRTDYGINPGNAEEKVSDEIQLKLSIAGFAPR
jgi:polyisoprenoid-binding protein YceI